MPNPIGVTPQELKIINNQNINVRAIGSKDVIRSLVKAGISEERAIQIREQNQPEFKSFGAKSAGALAQTERKEVAKALGLPSTASVNQINKKLELIKKNAQENTVVFKDGLGYSVAPEKQQAFLKLPTGDKIIYNNVGDAIGIETASLGGGLKSYSIENYNKEITRINKALPTSGYQNPLLDKFDLKKQGQGKFEESFNFKAYKNPESGEAFKSVKELNTYLKKNRIPTSDKREEFDLSRLTEPNYFDYFESINTPPKTRIENIKGNLKNTYENVKESDIGISIKDIYSDINLGLKTLITEPAFQGVEKVTGRKVSDLISSGVDYGIIGFPNYAFSEEIKDYEKGFFIGIEEDIREQPLKQVALYGGGRLLGFGFKGISTGLSAIPEVGGQASTAFKAGAVGYGIYTGAETALLTAEAIKLSKGPEEAGEIIGVLAKDITLIGAGFKGGQKDFDILKGRFRTRGLTELDVPQGEYPKAPSDKQLELFRKNIYKEISEKPIAFHTTPDVFYKNGKITPLAGTSELAGLYASTQVSTPFAKILGSSNSAILNNLKAFQRAILDSFAPEKNAGIATLEPKGFRESGFGYTKTKQFEGQKNLGTKSNPKYAYFKEPAKEGILDVPKMKTEIEAIARVDAGSYEATGKRFFTKIKGVRVPIDSFKFVEESIADELVKFKNKDIIELSNSKKFIPESYTNYRPSSGVTSVTSLSFSKVIESNMKSMISSINKLLSSSKVSVSSDILPSSSKGSSSARSSSIDSQISQAYSDISSQSTSSASSTTSSSSSKSSTKKSSSSKSSTANIASYDIPSYSKSISKPSQAQRESKKKLGRGYNIFIKQLKSNKFIKVNSYPLIESRAKDIGAYLVDTSVARTFRIEKTSGEAQADYQFLYIPEGYFRGQRAKLRQYRVKNKNPYDLDMERYIEKQKFVGDTQAEINQLKAFQREAKSILR